jgi:hypothetical protein
MGKFVGSEIEFSAPAGTFKFRINKIQPRGTNGI